MIRKEPLDMIFYTCSYIKPISAPPSEVNFPHSRDGGRSRGEMFQLWEKYRGVGFSLFSPFPKTGETLYCSRHTLPRRSGSQNSLAWVSWFLFPLFPAVLCNNLLFRKPRSEKSFGTIGLQLMDIECPERNLRKTLIFFSFFSGKLVFVPRKD